MASTALTKAALGRGPARRPPDRSRRPAARPYGQGRLRRLAALSLAVAIQLIAGAVLFRHAGILPKPSGPPVEVTLVETPEKPPDPPPPVPPVKLPPAPPVILPAPPVLRFEAPKPLAVSAAAAPSPIAPPAVAPPPPPAAQLFGIEDAFKAAVRAAVYAAHHVPDSARLLALFGETRVAFTLLDGHVGTIRLVAGSGHEALDAAALDAVRNAHYPPVPQELRGQTLNFEITLYRRQGQ